MRGEWTCSGRWEKPLRAPRAPSAAGRRHQQPRPYRPAFHPLARALGAGSVPEPSPGTPLPQRGHPPWGARLSAWLKIDTIWKPVPVHQRGGQMPLWVGPPPTTYVLLSGPWGQGPQNQRPGAALSPGLATQGERCFVSCHCLKSGTLAPGRGAGRVHSGFRLAEPRPRGQAAQWGPLPATGAGDPGGVVTAPPAR